MTWLITGGAGYIGSHVVDLFVSSGISVVVLDNLRSGNAKLIPTETPFIQGDITNTHDLNKLFTSYQVTGIINLAGLKSVEESARIPDEYFRVNSTGVETLITEAKKFGVKYFIQSSTAAVYGNLDTGVARETISPNPISNYGESKLNAEIILDKEIDFGNIAGTSLRYFNVVGAKDRNLKDISISNLFPVVANAIEQGVSPCVFGTDYRTRDGSCVRDYVHVSDLALAHLLTARQIQEKEIPNHLNIGTGQGYTVLEVIESFQRFHKSNLEVKIESRREGDPAVLTADVSLAAKVLGFKSEFDLSGMVATTFCLQP